MVAVHRPLTGSESVPPVMGEGDLLEWKELAHSNSRLHRIVGHAVEVVESFRILVRVALERVAQSSQRKSNSVSLQG